MMDGDTEFVYHHLRATETDLYPIVEKVLIVPPSLHVQKHALDSLLTSFPFMEILFLPFVRRLNLLPVVYSKDLNKEINA